MKFNKANEILYPGESVQESLPQPGGDDFLSRVNSTISNFKELLKMAKEFKGLAGSDVMGNEPAAPKSGQSGQSGFATFIQLLIQSGYGDTPIGELFDKVKPYTIKQIMEFVNRAGLKR